MNTIRQLISCLFLGSIILLAGCNDDDNNKNPDNGLEKGLVAHYSFKGGAAEDLSGNGNNGTVIGAESAGDQEFRENESMFFNSSTDMIYVADPSFLDSDSGAFAAWVKFDDVSHTQYLGSVGDEGSTDHYMSFIRVDGTDQTIGIYWRQGLEANWIKSTVTVTTGVYYHMVLVSDGSQFKVYLDGEELTLTTIQGANNGNWIKDIADLDNFVIGSSLLKAPYTIPYVSGNIDEVRLYNRPLSPQEVLQLYATTR